MAVAFERYEIAFVMSLINFLTLRYVKRFTDSDGDRQADK
jgi:putative Mg2+ transporter-C (MgtC) family protein